MSYSNQVTALSDDDLCFIVRAINDIDTQKELIGESEKTELTAKFSESTLNLALDAIHSSEVRDFVDTEYDKRFDS